MFYFGFEFSYLEISLFAVLLLAFIWQTVFYISIMAAFFWRKRKIRRNTVPFASPLPAVSVIVCSTDEDENLKRNIPLLLEQDYSQFEVIVVNECSEDGTERVLFELKSHYPQLRLTFVPLNTTLKNTRRLAIMLAVKAARHDFLLFTSPCCTPTSKNWIINMMRNFTPKTDFVLGMTLNETKHVFWKRIFALESFVSQLKMLAYANHGKAFTVNTENVACRKNVFYRNRSFAPYLNLHNGDIELLANREMQRHNVRIETCADSVLWKNCRPRFDDWKYEQKRRQNIESNFSFIRKNRIAGEVVWRYLFYISFALCAIIGNLLILAAALFLFALRTLLRILLINKIAKHCKFGKFGLSLMFVDFVLPFVEFFILMKKKNRY